MDIRAQIAMVFHLDKCIGCHTCSIACKNIWSDRKGTEYMWWNNVETKPGTGYPTLWENQDIYHGGWQLKDGNLKLRLHGRATGSPTFSITPRCRPSTITTSPGPTSTTIYSTLPKATTSPPPVQCR